MSDLQDPGLRLIVGLGNIGAEYERTRHNAGFWFVDELARAHGAHFSAERKFQGETARLRAGGREVWLLKPSTYMNRSGQSVVALALYYKILPTQMLVVHDELDLAPGVAKLKRGGGHAGHNGLRDIQAKLSTPDFWRLRLGIGHPGDRDQVIDYVLQRARPPEENAIVEAIDAGLESLAVFLRDGAEKAMHKLHTSSSKLASGQ